MPYDEARKSFRKAFKTPEEDEKKKPGMFDRLTKLLEPSQAGASADVVPEVKPLDKTATDFFDRMKKRK